MINRAVLVGRLTRDTELRYTTSGTAVGTFSLAVNRQFTNQAGEREADFINCVIWRKSAENFSNFTHKGSLVGIEGRIQTRNYENQQGQRVYVTEVVVENFSLLEPRSQNQNSAQTGNSSFDNHASNTPQGASTNDNPFGSPSSTGNKDSSAAANDPFASNGQSIDISDDDLPF
ncbi:single-stranded DNA-binding protein [Paucilactobacillus nenjiangensis]|jgi:single-strand DNA-binding protein|uniref:Single-stranded DNA-binding protein n=1 Tax=Paucilactobacillus nenjiangensis TaxID=1296540 RepID=A0A5P1X255_9LACO|nr:single-stranded DNA-binding protein [Paucilactobacillus nenjiangensis]QER66408.1 single-stranded DNA-binding protein [Paucilactobacillus nenjiangensis]